MDDAGIQIVAQGSDRELACPVCGEGVGAAPARCPICETPHHFDCWEYNEGCGVYGCNAQPKARPEGKDVGTVDLPAKLGLPHKRTGSYAGVWWVPPGGAAAIGFELIGILAFAAGNTLAGAGWMAAMVGCLVWIGLSSIHYYVDFEKMRISKAKAFLGRDIFEWGVLDLAKVERLEIRRTEHWVPGDPNGPKAIYRVVAVKKPSWGVQGELEICPPMREGEPILGDVADLFRRIHASHAFAVRMPEEIRALPPPGRNTLLLEE